ncbi:MAG: hypothetical protein HYY17_16195 [Planctomycetes bacterium]|nr:hypothetical protein [Planctomycetota bacterium]
MGSAAQRLARGTRIAVGLLVLGSLCVRRWPHVEQQPRAPLIERGAHDLAPLARPRLEASWGHEGIRCATPDGSSAIGLKLAEIRRGAHGASYDTPSGVARHEDGVELFYDDGVREQYVKRGESYEQILRLEGPLAGAGDLVATTRVETTLPYAGVRAGGPLAFAGPAPYQFAFIGTPYVYDASGRGAPAAMTFDQESSTYSILVPAAWLEAATYPVVIDPLLTFEDLLGDPTIGPWIGVLPDSDIEAMTGIPIAFPQWPVPPSSSASIILTVAGGGGVADGPAPQAGFNGPLAIALGAANNVYIADTLNHRIRVHNRGADATFNTIPIAAGEVGTIAGDGNAGTTGDGGLAIPSYPAPPARINTPSHIAVDGVGTVYFSETARIRKVATDGTITTLIGTGSAGYSGDGGPASAAQVGIVRGLIVRGDLLIFADSSNHRVRAVNIGTAATSILGKTIAPGNVDTVLGNGIAANTGDGTSALFPTGAPGENSPISINSPGFATGGLALDAASNLYVHAFTGVVGAAVVARIRVVNLATSPPLVFGGATTTTIPLNGIDTVLGGGSDAFGEGSDRLAAAANVTGFDVDTTGRLFWRDVNTIAPYAAARIRRMDNVTGIVTTISGGLNAGFAGDGGPASAARWLAGGNVRIPKAGAEAGHIFVADQGNNKIRKIAGGEQTSIVSSLAGTGFSGASGDDALSYTASLGRPTGVRFRTEGGEPRFFGVEFNNNRVFQIDAPGKLTTLVGKGVTGSSGDKGPAVDALLSGPADVSFDPAGNAYIADNRNGAIRVINRQGTPLQVGSVTIAAGNIDTVAGELANGGFDVEGGPQLDVRLWLPSSVDISTTTAAVYVLDFRNNRLRVLNRNAPGGASITVLGVTVPPGEMWTVIPGPQVGGVLGFPSNVRLDPSNDDILLTDLNNNRVLRITQGGVVTVLASLPFPDGLAVGLGGDVFVTSRIADRIYKISGGVLTTIAGDGIRRFAGDGGDAGAASFYAPNSLDVEVLDAAAGKYRLYVSDEGNNRLRRIQPEEAAAGTVLPAGTYQPIPGVTITTSQPGWTTDPAKPGYFSVLASPIGPPAPQDFKIGKGAKSIYFTIDAVNLTFAAGNEFTITIFWDDEFDCPPEAPIKLFRWNGTDWVPISGPGDTDCGTHTTTGTTTSLSIFKVFRAVPVPLNVTVEPERVKRNPGIFTVFVSPLAPVTMSALVPGSFTVNGQTPGKVLQSSDTFLLKVQRSAIVDLGNGTGLVRVSVDLIDGRVGAGEAIVPIR